MENITDVELARLRAISDAATPGPWVAQIEGRDHVSGDTFILIGEEGNRGDDLYLLRDTTPASAADFEFVAAARSYLPKLLDEIARLRRALSDRPS